MIHSRTNVTRILEKFFSTSGVMFQFGSTVLLVLALVQTVSTGLFDERNVLITSFKYKPCDPNSYSKNGAWIKDIDVLTTIYGDLDVVGTFVTAVNLTSPVKASVSLRRHLLGIYVPVPCIRKFGSCTYSDLCDYGYSSDEDCPAIFEEHDVPCRCPIKPGIYNIPGAQFPVPKTRWASILAVILTAAFVVLTALTSYIPQPPESTFMSSSAD